MSWTSFALKALEFIPPAWKWGRETLFPVRAVPGIQIVTHHRREAGSTFKFKLYLEITSNRELAFFGPAVFWPNNRSPLRADPKSKTLAGK